MKKTLILNGIRFPFIFVEGNNRISSFWIGETPVTQKQYQVITGNNPSYFMCKPQNPVECVSWNDCQEFIDKLKSLTKNLDFDLPSEKQWKFAAKGGIYSQNFNYSGSNNADEVAWFRRNTNNTQPVGLKKPNELGIYDMSGNVGEWTNTWTNTRERIVCGGSFSNIEPMNDFLKRVTPERRYNALGFRLVVNI